MLSYILIALFFYSLFAFLVSFKKVKDGNTHGDSYMFFPLGAFVWADTLVLSLFWLSVSFVFFFYPNRYLFYIVVSLFWFIRSLGETMYWLHEQFTSKHHNPPSKYIHFALFKNESVWFVNQVLWQIISVLSATTALIFIKVWLNS